MSSVVSEGFKVSLVIPAYNEEKYLPDCLRSALDCGDVFDEIIVIDNASTDNTSLIASSFPGVRVVREDKKGLTYARQRGYLEAKGDILACVDADTKIPKGWLSFIKSTFEKKKEVVCLSGPYDYFDLSKTQRFFLKYFFWYLAAMPSYYIVGYMTIGGNFAIRKETLDKMNGFDTSIAFYGEDTDIARRASKFGKVLFSPKFVMPTSARRLKGQGVAYTGYVYIKNFFSEVLLGRPSTGEYKDIR